MAVTLESLDLAALLCSRVCHDLISPAGAIVNGLEVLDEAESTGGEDAIQMKASICRHTSPAVPRSIQWRASSSLMPWYNA